MPLSRQSDHRLLLLTGAASVLVALTLITIKGGVWWFSGSVSLLASLIDSVMDSLASLVNFFAIRYSLQPADEEHRFGHGKAEALAGLGQATLIAISALLLGREAVLKLLDPQPVTQLEWAIGVMLVSILLTFMLLMLQRYTIRRTGSTAIEADSLHYLSDLAVNVGIIVALIASLNGYLWVDGTVALLIAVYIFYAAWGIGNESVQLLLDREIPGNVREEIGSIVASHPQALGFHQLRTRQSGRTQFIQLHVDMEESLSLRDAHDLAERIEMDIRARFPMADVIIHEDPVKASPLVTLADKPEQ
jgi:ferrous-iron efflux pump FieF